MSRRTTLWANGVALVAAFALASSAIAAPPGKKAPVASKLRGVTATAIDLGVDAAVGTQAEAKRAPAKLEFGRQRDGRADDAREAAVSQKRRDAIASIDELLAKAGPRYPARADRIYQKAELLWEEGKYVHFRELEEYDPASGKPEPAPDFRTAIEAYRQVLTEHADFPLADEIRCHMGFALAEAGQEASAIAVLEELARKHPRSQFVPEARVALGELHFAAEELDAALVEYRAVVARFPKHELAPFAKYKVGWTLHRLEQRDAAITELIAAIDDEGRLTGRPRIPIREQALADLLVVVAEVPGAWHRAAEFYERKGGEPMLRHELLRYAKLQAQTDRIADATEVLEWLTLRAPLDARVVEYDSLRFDLVRRQRKPDEAEVEAARLVRLHAPGGTWASAGTRTAVERQRAHDLAESALLFSAALRHEQAQRSAKKEVYEQAGVAYREHLSRYASSAKVGTTTFRLAEVSLQLLQHARAGELYSAAARAITGPVGDDAAYKAVFAWALAARETGLHDTASLPPDDDSRAASPAPTPLTDAELALIAAADQYAARLPESDDAPEVLLVAARAHYLRFHLTEGARRLIVLVDRYPNSARAGDAAALALDAWNRLRDWPKLVLLADRMIREQRFEHLDERALREVIAGASAQAAYVLEAKQDFAGAAEVLIAVVTQNPRSAKNPDRIATAAGHLVRVGRRDRAAELYARLVTDHAQTPAGVRAAFALGALREERGDLAGAALAYARAATLPKTEATAGALFNAATLFQTLGDLPRAAALFDSYVTDHPTRPDAPEVALRAAALHERAGKAPLALERYRGFAKRFPAAPAHLALEAAARACELLTAQDAKQGRAACVAVVESAKKAGGQAQPGPAARAGSRAQLALAEQLAAETEAITLELPVATLVKRLQEKLARLEATAAAYTEVATWPEVSAGERGFVRVGEVYARFAAAVRAAPVPPELVGDELDAYNAEIADRAAQIDEAALAALEQFAGLVASGRLSVQTGAAAAMQRKYDAAADPWRGEAPPMVDLLPELGGGSWQ